MSQIGPQAPSSRRGMVIAIALIVVLSLVAGGAIYWLNRPSNSFRDIGGGVSVSQDAPDKVHAVVDGRIPRMKLNNVQPLGPVVHVTPDGSLGKSVTLRFKFDRKISDPRDVIIAVNQTGKADGWQLVAPTKVEGQFAYVTTNHLSWWEALWRSFTNLVDETVKELKRQFDALSGDAFAEAEKPKCKDEQDARDKGYSIKWKGAEVLYWCLGLDDGKPIVRVVNKRRYPIFVNHRGIGVSELPKAKFGVEWLSRKSFSDNRTVMMPFDQIRLNYELAKGENKSFSTEYNGFAESLYQLEFGITSLLNILTRFGAGGGTISNGAITITKFDQIADVMSKVLGVKDCANALKEDKPNSGAILSGCFSPDAIMTMFGWKGVLLATVMVVGPVINFFRNSFDTLGDLLQGKDQERVTVSYNPPPPSKALFVGTWTVHGAQLVISRDGTGSLTFNAGPCPTPTNDSNMCEGHGSIIFKVNGNSMTGTYTRVWYTSSDGSPAPDSLNMSSPETGGVFSIRRNDPHTLITSESNGDNGPGNPYLCDSYAMARNDGEYMKCGA